MSESPNKSRSVTVVAYVNNRGRDEGKDGRERGQNSAEIDSDKDSLRASNKGTVSMGVHLAPATGARRG